MNQVETLAQMVARLDDEFSRTKPVMTFTALLPISVTFETFRSAIEAWSVENNYYIGDVRYRTQPKLDAVKIVIGVATTGDIYRNKYDYE